MWGRGWKDSGSIIDKVFFDEQGFSTAGAAVALLVALALLFSSARVYEVLSSSADVQEVADVCALAAENEVAEFMVVVRVCDAVVLSLSLTGLTAYGLGVVALCVPATQPLGEELIEAGGKVLDARDTFSRNASRGLDALQRALPFLSAARAALLASSNNAGSSSYAGFAMLLPSEGATIAVPEKSDEQGDFEDALDQSADALEEAAAAADEAAQKLQDAKEKGFEHDCGAYPGYCLYQRAETLSGVAPSDNPRYSSVDAWSFSVPLKRARAYYRVRLREEAPQDSSVEEQARSALRRQFYSYAVQALDAAYVVDDGNAFEAYFPSLPRTTAEMRTTSLYTDAVYPISVSESGAQVMHAWSGCPGAMQIVGSGSLSQMEQGGFERCAHCGFDAASLGRVASASSNIENGFEYHYAAVAEAAREYQRAYEEYAPRESEVKSAVDDLLDSLKEAFEATADCRIDAQPPGSMGVLSIVVDLGSSSSSASFASSFVDEVGPRGACVAVSSATLVEDSEEEGLNVITSILDGLGDDPGVLGVSGRIVLGCWSGMLSVYGKGQQGLVDAVEQALESVPFASASGLGTWAADKLSSLIESLGLQPAKLGALKPALVDSVSVARADSSAFAKRYLSVHDAAETMVGANTPFDFVSGAARSFAQDVLGYADDGKIHVVTVTLPLGDAPIDVTLPLPQAVSDATGGLLDAVLQGIASVCVDPSAMRVWE